MHYTTTTLPKSEMEIRATLTTEEMRPFYDQTLRETAAAAEMNGFRKGKAPEGLIKKAMGEFGLWKQAAVLAVEKTYPKILKELSQNKGDEFEPIGEPTIEILKLSEGEPVEFKARLALLPIFTLPDYKGIAKKIISKKKEVRVEEKELADALLWLQESRAKVVRVSRTAESGDQVTIDFEATESGNALPGGVAKDHQVVIGEKKFMPGFEEALTGMRENETKKISLATPADYHEKELRGKKIDFSVLVKMVAERTVPELTDAFAKNVGAFEGLEALKKSIAEGIRNEKEQKDQEKIRIAVADAIAEKTATDIPDILVDRERAKMLDELKSGIERMGLQWDTYLAHIKKGEEELRSGWTRDAERRVKIALLLRKIGKKENLVPTEKEIQEATNQTTARIGIDEEGFSAKGGSASGGKKIDQKAFLEYNTTVARNEKVFKFLENPE